MDQRSNGYEVRYPLITTAGWFDSGMSTLRGYVGATESNLAALTLDGWYRTGDIATVDEEGFFYIVDRKKELIKVYTFQGASSLLLLYNVRYLYNHRISVPPAEIEAVLSEHPDISDVGVIGVPSSDQLTELPRSATLGIYWINIMRIRLA